MTPAPRLLAVAFVTGLAFCAAAPAQPVPSAAQALAPVFQLDMATTLARLRAVPEAALNDGQRRVRDCILGRFGGAAAPVAAESLPAPAGDILAAYRRYWTASLLHTATPAEAEARLSSDLAAFASPTATDLGDREEAAIKAIEAQGLHVLGGETPPLHELMLWRKQSSALQTVALPGGAVEVRVTMLDDFASYGWGAWGTCDAAHTGGWATPEAGIMVVAPSWNLDSESYRISLLAHESQHFSDYRRYPKLSPPDLEYRAKLVELAQARETQGALLAKFGAEAARDRRLPHPFASWWLLERLHARLGADLAADASGDAVRGAAAAELQAHGAALDAKGPLDAVTALAD